MKVLVTGATGFLGSHLVPKLIQQGYDVRALARGTSNVSRLTKCGAEVVYGDLKDKDTLRYAVEGIDTVYHLGAATGGSWEEYEESTVKGTRRMLELALQGGEVRRFVHISSLAVYRTYGLERNALVDESYPIEQNAERVGPYAYSKVESERQVLRFYKKEGLPAVIVRPGLIYGPGRGIFFPHLGSFITKRMFIVIGGDILLPLTYIDNTVDGILLAGTREEALGQTYNIVDDGGITQREYIERLKAATHLKFTTLSVPPSQFVLLATLAEKSKRLPILSKVLRKAPLPSRYALVSKFQSLRFDSSKAKKELNWQPKVSLEEGLKKTFEWYNTVGTGQKPST